MSTEEAFIRLFAMASEHLGNIATQFAVFNGLFVIYLIFCVINFFAKRDR